MKVFKSGLFTALAHDHSIDAPIAGGTTDATAHRLEVHVAAAALRVRDPNVSDKDRDEIQKTMLGPAVLDVGRYPEIVFQSTSAEQARPGSWTVKGTLTIHGQNRPLNIDVSESAGLYSGEADLKLTDFGIQPIKVAGGAVKVKNEIRIEFNIESN